MTCVWGRRPGRRALLSALALCLAFSMAAILPTTGGAAAAPAPAAAVPTDEQLAADEAPTPKKCGAPPLNGCRLTWYGAQAPTLVVWGDSHMWMMTPAVKKAAAGKRVNIVLFFLGGCIPAAPDMEIYDGNACAELSVSAMKYLQQLEAGGRPYRLLLGSFWGANLNRVYWYENQERADIMKKRRVYTQAYTRPLFRALGRAGIPTDVSFQGPISVPPSDCGGTWPFWCPVNRTRAYYKDTYVRNWLARRMSFLPDGARLVDFSDGICSATSCPAVVNGVHTWFDPYHVSATKATKLASYYKPTVQWLLKRR
jgi:hypothetical protein